MSLERLQAAAAHLATIDPPLSAWLAGAAGKVARGTPPALALDLAGTGARRERDKWLLQAALLLGSGEPLWHLAGAIARRLVHPRHRDAAQDLLSMADKAYRLPRSHRGVYRVLVRLMVTDKPVIETSARTMDS